MHEIQIETIQYLFRAKFGVQIMDYNEHDPVNTALSEAAENFIPPSDEISHSATVRTEHVGRNEPCPCGSGKKYKKCCGLK